MKIKAKTKLNKFPKNKKVEGKGVKKKKKLLKKKLVLLRKKKVSKRIAKKPNALKKPEKCVGAKRKQKKTNQKKISSQTSLGKYLQGIKIDRNRHGNLYKQIKVWENIFEKIERGIERFFKFVFWFSYRAAIFSFILILIYAISPGALSAPEEIEVSLKHEWEQGTLTNVTTHGSASTEDAIQLESTGTWNARVWEPAPDIISTGHSSVIVGTDIYVFRGYSDTAFWKYDTLRNEWEVLDDAPFPAYYGADMAYDGTGNIFAIFGGYSKKAYKYNIENKEWIQLPDLPDTVYSGGAIEADGSDIYVIRGNGSNDFWKYSATEGWPNMNLASCNVTTGGTLVNGQDGYLYLGCGGRTNYNFYKYKLGTGAGAGLWTVGTSLTTGYGLEG